MESGRDLTYPQPDDKAFHFENIEEINSEIQALEKLFTLEVNLNWDNWDNKDIDLIIRHFSTLLFRYQMISIEDKTDHDVKTFTETLEKAQAFLDYLIFKIKTLSNGMMRGDTLSKLDRFNFGQKIHAPSTKIPIAVRHIVEYFKTFLAFQSEQAKFLKEEKITEEMVENYREDLMRIKDALQSLEIIIDGVYPIIIPSEVAHDYAVRSEMTMGAKARENLINAIGDLQGIIPIAVLSDNNAERPLKARRKKEDTTAVVQSFEGLSVEDKKDKEEEDAMLKEAMAMSLDASDTKPTSQNGKEEDKVTAEMGKLEIGKHDHGQLTFKQPEQPERRKVKRNPNPTIYNPDSSPGQQEFQDETGHTISRKRGSGG